MPTGNVTDTAGLAAAATAVLGHTGLDDALRQPVADGLRGAWQSYFGAPVPPGATNWNAYTHQQLYDMLWHNADVADVGSIADEWDQHGAELSSQASALRDRQAALRSTWTGDAADSATAALGRLGDRTETTGTRATTVAEAVRQAGDALTLARNTMPPPSDPVDVVLTGVIVGAGVGAVLGGALGGAATGGYGAAPGALMGAGIGAVAGGAASMFVASAEAAQRKAEAVRVMTNYESNLHNAAQAMPAGIGAGGDSGTTTSAFVGSGSIGTGGGMGGSGAGVPWQRLVGANPGAAPPRSGASPLTDAALARTGLLPGEEAAADMTNIGGMYPPGVRTGLGGEDEEHRDQLPHPVQNYFAVEGGTVVPVIGGADR
jgi:hypothetical protein